MINSLNNQILTYLNNLIHINNKPKMKIINKNILGFVSEGIFIKKSKLINKH
jgi:hypothetical protein